MISRTDPPGATTPERSGSGGGADGAAGGPAGSAPAGGAGGGGEGIGGAMGAGSVSRSVCTGPLGRPFGGLTCSARFGGPRGGWSEEYTVPRSSHQPVGLPLAPSCATSQEARTKPEDIA